jgi:hypothetical protein
MRALSFDRRLLLCISLAAGLPNLSVAQLPPPPSGIYACTDQYGRNLKSDRPIAECADREQRQLNPDGSLKRVIITAEEQRRRDEAATAAQRAKIEGNEQARRDRIMLQRYPNEETWERLMREALSTPVSTWEGAVDRISAARKEAIQLGEETEFYKRTTIPLALKRKIDQNEITIASELALIQTQREEINRIRDRFAADLRKLRRLWAEQR